MCSRKKRLGATTVEMAVVLPVFLAILFGFIEISRLSFAVNTTQVALIKATRELSLPNATAEAGENAAKDYLTRLGYSEEDITITISPSTISDNTPEITMDIDLSMQPLPYTVHKSLTRSRE
ncbi:pilus assembly protein [Mariniblastus sp.]|nr:pilus assembly protein [Mariniblastus sp.]